MKENNVNTKQQVLADSYIIQNDIRYTKLEGSNSYKKEGVDWMGKQFHYTKCQFCDRIISNCGFASKKHYQMHVKNNFR